MTGFSPRISIGNINGLEAVRRNGVEATLGNLIDFTGKLDVTVVTSVKVPLMRIRQCLGHACP